MSNSKLALSASGTKIASSLPVAEAASERAGQASLPLSAPDNEAAALAENADLAPPPFNPFFTLIEDATTSEHFHPTVHYIFSDDDADVLTEVSLRAASLSASSTSNSNDLTMLRAAVPNHQQQQQRESGSGSESRTSSSSQRASHHKTKDARANRNQERYLIVDMGPSGDTIAAVRSFSSHWQPLGAEITKAPTWDADEMPKPDQAAGLMLRIEGVQSLHAADPAWDAQEDVPDEAIPELVELFEKRMNTLKRVIESGEMAEQRLGGEEEE